MDAPITARLPRGQLPLLPPPAQDSFEQFIVASENALAVERLRSASGVSMLVYGPPQSGRSHLLKALCREAECGSARYLPLSAACSAPPGEVCERLSDQRLVCVDDLGQVAGDALWERSLYALFEGARRRGATLVFSASGPPAALGVQLPDLQSRLESCLTLRLAALRDEHKGELVRRHARLLGLKIEPPVVNYMLRRVSRAPAELLELLARLAQSLSSQRRRVSIDAVRRLLEEDGARLGQPGGDGC